MRRTGQVIGLLALTACLMIGCRKSDPGTANAPSGEKAQNGGVLNLFWWSDFMAPDTIPNFEKRTGIKVRISYFDTNETLEVRLPRFCQRKCRGNPIPKTGYRDR
jgi:putrescine transport system substrate-binding protein